MTKIEGLIEQLLKRVQGVGDIHVKQNRPLSFRSPSGAWVMPPEGKEAEWLITFDDISEFMDVFRPDWLEAMARLGSVSHTHQLPSKYRIRVEAFSMDAGAHKGMSIRVLPAVVPLPSEIGVPPSLTMLLDGKPGIVIVSGPTGSGKSTTIASLCEYLNRERSMHIQTIEDPIEYVYEDKKSFFTQREVGTADCATFGHGIRASLRQRPDVVVIGEIRDEESATAALSMSESGHIVMCSLHANNAIGALHKLSFLCRSEVHQEGVFDVLGRTVLGVVNQVMLPSVNGGRVPAFEMLFNNKNQVSGFIGDVAKLSAHMDGCVENSTSMSLYIQDLVKRNLVTREAALASGRYNPAQVQGRPNAVGR